MNSAESLPLGEKALAEAHAELHAWYQRHGRHHLPWRTANDPYAIYISEVMLQQTQVKTVLERYYFPFLERFPTLSALAEAEEKELLKLWQGLGYYRRAANLHKAAKQAAPTLPDTVEGLMALPGIGRNTAHAVAAFGFRQPVPVMEANVKRILCRVFAMESPTDSELWEKAWALLDRQNSFDYNQAMMDIGSGICTPLRPACSLCPLNRICAGKETPERYPAPKAEKTIPTRRQFILVCRDERGSYYYPARTGAFLSGMHQFLEREGEFSASTPSAVEIDGRSFPLLALKKLGSIDHAYSHFRLEAEVALAQLQGNGGNSTDWVNAEALNALPHSRTEAKIIKLLYSSGSLTSLYHPQPE
jgi:A/G-specific adenine glycosylase